MVHDGRRWSSTQHSNHDSRLMIFMNLGLTVTRTADNIDRVFTSSPVFQSVRRGHESIAGRMAHGAVAPGLGARQWQRARRALDSDRGLAEQSSGGGL